MGALNDDDAPTGRFAAGLRGARSRPAISFAALLALMLGAFFGPRLVSTSFLAAFVEKGVCPEFGASCHVTGALHIRLLPYPAVEVAGLSARLKSGRATVAAEQAIAELRVLPLFLGRFSVSQLNLTGASIELAAPPEGMRLLATANGAGAMLVNEMVAVDGIRSRPSRIVVRRSKLTLDQPMPGVPLVVDDFAAAAAWSRDGGALSAHIAGRLDDDSLAISLEGPSFAELRRTEGSHVALDAVLGGNVISFTGRLVETGDLVAAGTMRVALPSVRRVATALGHPDWPSWLSDMPLRFGGPVFISSRGVDLDNADFQLAHSRFSGVLSLRTTNDGRPSLMGTLATASVNLGDLAHIVHSDIVLPDLARLPDLDLRLSVLRLTTKKTSISGVAMALILAERRFDLTLSRGTPGTSGGRLRIVATPDEEGVAVKSQLTTENADIGAALSALSIHAGLSGTGSFSSSLDAHGRDIDALARSLAGKASLQMKDGALSLDAGATPAGATGGQEVASAPSPILRRFTQASFVGSVERGVLGLDEGRIGSGAAQIGVTGTFDIPRRSLDLSFEKPGAQPDEAPWSVRATGPWSQPVLRRQR